MKAKLLIVFALLIMIKAKAQDHTFSQFNSVPLYFNPAFAGSVEKSRLALSYRNQWSSTYQDFYLSYDQALKKLHGGVGIIVYDNKFKTSNIFYSGIIYAPKFNVFNKIAISPAIKIGYRRGYLDTDGLTFGNQIDPNRGFVYQNGFVHQTNEKILETTNNLDISSGLVINTEKFYAGFAVDHLNQPNVSPLKSGKDLLKRKYTFQLGYTFQKNDSADFSLSPSLLYFRQSRYIFDAPDERVYDALFQANLSFRYKWAILGVGHTSVPAYIFMLGYYSKNLVIGYSYDYHPELSSVSSIQYTHEVSLKYFFTLKKKPKEIKK